MNHNFLHVIPFCGCVLLLALSVLLLAEPAKAAESEVPYIQKLIQYYRYYQESASDEIDTLLGYITYLDATQGIMWQNIMEDWSWCNSEMTVNPDVLPDGLPEDDSLCIVVLGYALNSDGSMRSELIDRLQVALRSAEKYPNAYIALTGGGTASVSSITEAEVMAAWLRANGIASDHLILETKSRSTTYNAINTYRILEQSYPSVSSLAIVSSDYHVPWGCVMFQTVSDRAAYQGGQAIRVVGNAANATGTSMNTIDYQAKGISIIMGIDYADLGAPAIQ